MKLERHQISTIHKMITRFQEIQKDLKEFTHEEQEFILNMHSEGHTLQHSLRWGEQALYDILEEVE